MKVSTGRPEKMKFFAFSVDGAIIHCWWKKEWISTSFIIQNVFIKNKVLCKTSTCQVCCKNPSAVQFITPDFFLLPYRLYVNWRFMRGIEAQFLALQKGFNELIPQHLLKPFDQKELEVCFIHMDSSSVICLIRSQALILKNKQKTTKHKTYSILCTRKLSICLTKPF